MSTQQNVEEIIDSLMKENVLINVCCGTYVGDDIKTCNKVLIDGRWHEYNNPKIKNYDFRSGDICPECFQLYTNETGKPIKLSEEHR